MSLTGKTDTIYFTNFFVRNAATSAGDTAQSTFNSASDSLKGTADQASKEGNKRKWSIVVAVSSPASLLTLETEVAKDDSASAGTRANAAKDAVGDKANEVKHSVCPFLINNDDAMELTIYPSLEHVSPDSIQGCHRFEDGLKVLVTPCRERGLA